MVYDFGNGHVTVTDENKVKVGDWNTVYIEQKDHFVSLVVNDGQAMKSQSTGAQSSLSLTKSSVIHIGKRLRDAPGFQGCIRELIVNSERLELTKEYIAHDQITSCYTQASVCQSNPCLHNSTCQSDGSTVKCKCTPSYTGEYCESKLSNCGRLGPCENGGICRQSSIDNSNYCSCPLGYAGDVCKKGRFTL